jgi:hypothetical protein
MIDFTKINYLKNGNEKQKRAYEVLTRYQIFEKLKDYSPILAGTIPIEIDIEESDIICEVDLNFEEDFLEEVSFKKIVPAETEVTVENIMIENEKAIVINFRLEEFSIEIFGQNRPATKQNAYLHMIAEYKILQEKGEDFKQKIIKLKKQGIKTEPAFGILLNLENPYEDLLKMI